jgi:hypothetical protein
MEANNTRIAKPKRMPAIINLPSGVRITTSGFAGL